MALVSISCPACNHPGNIPEVHLGKKVRCKKCGNLFVAARAVEPEPELVADGFPAPPDSSLAGDTVQFVCLCCKDEYAVSSSCIGKVILCRSCSEPGRPHGVADLVECSQSAEAVSKQVAIPRRVVAICTVSFLVLTAGSLVAWQLVERGRTPALAAQERDNSAEELRVATAAEENFRKEVQEKRDRDSFQAMMGKIEEERQKLEEDRRKIEADRSKLAAVHNEIEAAREEKRKIAEAQEEEKRRVQRSREELSKQAEKRLWAEAKNKRTVDFILRVHRLFDPRQLEEAARTGNGKPFPPESSLLAIVALFSDSERTGCTRLVREIAGDFIPEGTSWTLKEAWDYMDKAFDYYEGQLPATVTQPSPSPSVAQQPGGLRKKVYRFLITSTELDSKGKTFTRNFQKSVEAFSYSAARQMIVSEYPKASVSGLNIYD